MKDEGFLIEPSKNLIEGFLIEVTYTFKPSFKSKDFLNSNT